MPQQESILAMLTQLAIQLDRQSVVELVELFFDNTSTTLAKITTAASKGDLVLLSQEAHALKSSSANLGAVGLSNVCQRLERSQQLNLSTDALINEAKQEFADATTIMKNWLAGAH